MNKTDFINKNSAALGGLVKISQDAGSRLDYTQGGGGNTSAKLADNLMAIKASGYMLTQITTDDGYAVLDYATLRDFYSKPPQDDAEEAGSTAAKAAAVHISGLKELRPSVEAGFHSLLDNYVVHTHSVYANLLTCCKEGEDLLEKAMDGFDGGWCVVEYTNPGVNLTFSIQREMKKVHDALGKNPSIIFMKNHGVIATAKDAHTALALHDEANERIARLLGIDTGAFPRLALEERSAHIHSASAYIKNALKGSSYTLKFLTEDTIYPDQLVYLGGNLAVEQTAPAQLSAKCTIIISTGEVIYNCPLREAQTIEETLLAVLFVVETIKAKGLTLRTMDAAGKDFISNWESEAYRKSLLK